MIAFLARRLLQILLVLWIMSVAVYGLIGLMPGDPIDLMVRANPRLSTADIARLKGVYGLDRPLWERYAGWAQRALSGEFGYSRLYHKPVGEVLAPRLLNTLILLGSAVVLAVVIAIPLGALAGRLAGTGFDRAVNLLCFAGVSVPPFWLALLALLLFSVTLGWLPAGGSGGDHWMERLRHMVLPVGTLTLASLAGYTRYVRAAMIEALREPFIRTARAKGLSEAAVLWNHALGNALLPVVTLMALDAGSLFSGALITETMFSYPGMGKAIYDAVMGNDYNLAMAALMLTTAATLLATLGADLVYGWLDPRIDLQRRPP